MTVSIERALELELRARQQLVFLINDDLEGRSENLKELWEETISKDEQEVVNVELKRIVKFLKSSLRP